MIQFKYIQIMLDSSRHNSDCCAQTTCRYFCPIVGTPGQSFLYERSVPCKTQVGPRHSTHQEGGIGCSGSIQLPSGRITNLVTIFKILERLVLVRIQPHVHMSKQFSSIQSAYRRRHSTETALLRVVNDLNSSTESGSKSILLSLDMSRLHSIQSTPTNYCSDWSLISASTG